MLQSCEVTLSIEHPYETLMLMAMSVEVVIHSYLYFVEIFIMYGVKIAVGIENIFFLSKCCVGGNYVGI